MARRLTNFETVDDFKKSHGDRYDYSLVEYKNNHTKVKILCKKHGVFEQIPSSHKKGIGCGSCALNKPLTTELFIQKAKEIHGDTYDYSKCTYYRSAKPVTIICKIHGYFQQKPNAHLSAGSGCAICSAKGAGENKSKNKIINQNKNTEFNYLENTFSIKIKGKVLIGDLEDYEKIKNICWVTTTLRRVQTYALGKIDGKLTLFHRFLLDITNPKVQIDHINHNGLDNRKINIRACTNNENNYNKRKRNNTSSKYKGVCWVKSKLRWRVLTTKDYVSYNLGYFTSEEEAALAYNKKAKELFGEFANLNIIDNNSK